MPILFGTHRTALEPDLQGRAFVWSAQPTNPVVVYVPPVTMQVITQQEQPWHPAPFFAAGAAIMRQPLKLWTTYRRPRSYLAR